MMEHLRVCVGIPKGVCAAREVLAVKLQGISLQVEGSGASGISIYCDDFLTFSNSTRIKNMLCLGN